MKASALLCVCIAVYAVSAIPINENLEIFEYPQIIEVQNDDGLIDIIDLGATPNMVLIEDYARNPYNNRYSLYTRKNPTNSQNLFIYNEVSIKASNFDAERPTVVIVHGWLQNQIVTMTSSLRDAFLEKEDVNLIVLDWTLLAIQDYVSASAGTPHVGLGLAYFLRYLRLVTGVSYESMHLVGFSLGAHAVGIAGRELDGKIARITGLDPAGPLWTINPLRLNKDDAVYVEAIHTHGGVDGFGIGFAVGDVDFFPNGGTSQPGCLTKYCDHNRSWNLFGATVRYNHLIGNQCANLLQISLNTCRGTALHLGNSLLDKKGAGMFRVNTGRIYPY